MTARLSDVIEILNRIEQGVQEVIVYKDELKVIKSVLDECKYIYLERPTNSNFTIIKMSLK